jgi:cbb3-type cytochrome oxidase cytochrome c subunit
MVGLPVFKKRRSTPIERRDYSLYYLVFSGILFLGTMWAVVDEISTRRPWKDTQKEYYALLKHRVHERLNEAIADLDSLALEELEGERKAAQDSINGPVYQRAFAQLNNVLEHIQNETRDFQFAKSRGDEAYYFWKKSIQDGKEDAGQKQKLDKNEAQMAAHQAVISVLEVERDSLRAIITEYRQALRNVQNKIADLQKNVEKWETKLRRVNGASVEIRQVMMLDYDRNPFNDPKARIDRCQSCHLGWNEEVMADVPEPYKKHPVPELLAIHNPEVYGCTPCHRGQGAALTAGFAHGDEDHYWENPLLKGKEIYASCNECHENQSSLKFAPVFAKAKRLMIESGCHGCHEIKGYTDLPKIGPDLNRVSYKASPSWLFRWIKNPKDYNPHTRMPNFLFSDEQAEAVTAFLVDLSSRNSFSIPKGAFSGGRATEGKALVERVGCMGCHVVGEETRLRAARTTSYDIAPELTRVGSKVTADWAFDWIRNPRHYNPTTKMPSLRLTDAEARDIVAYVMTLKDERTYEEKALNLSSPTAIKRGEGLIREFGCHGCHAIQGFEKESRVSVSLSNFGRKHVEEMDFGDTKVHHTWSDWVGAKLKNARAFQTDRIVQKMPVFSFSDEEIDLLRLFLRSQTKDEPDKKYVQEFDRKQQNIETGRRIAIAYNCQQCHELENWGAHIGALLPPDDQTNLPPIITGEGRKVQEPWLHGFLMSPASPGQPNPVRPWITTRMPTFHFTDDEISKLTKYFLGLGNLELEVRDYASFRPDPRILPAGKQLFTDFECAKCHPSGTYKARPGEASTQDLAPNLSLARGRLKPEWIIEWLSDPQKVQPGTRMPTFWPDGESPLPDLLEGDAVKQMTAIRDYLMTIGEPRRATVASRE